MIKKVRNRELYRYSRRRLFPDEERRGLFIHQIALAVTSRCQARCIMCHSWQVNPGKEFSLDELELFLNASKLPYLKDVSLTGGDPYLRDDLVEIARLISEHYPKINFFVPTNGLDCDRIVEKAKAINRFSNIVVCISMDGIEDADDLIRGQKDAFDKTIATVNMLKDERIKLVWSFTILPQNVGQIYKVYELSKRYTEGINITFRPAGCGFYFNTQGNPFILKGEVLKKAISELERINEEYKSYWLKYVIHFLKTGRKLIPCGAGRYSCVVMPNLDVFPCTHCPEPWRLGSLKDYGYSLNDLLESCSSQRTLDGHVKECDMCVNEIEGFSTIASHPRSLFSSFAADLKFFMDKMK